jgi:hypothetical protein
MRLYLDSRDLINVISRRRPVGPDELRTLLTDRDTTLVYSWSSVLETVNVGNLRESRARLEILDGFPHSFILGLPVLIRAEFRTALAAFRRQNAEFISLKPWETRLDKAIRDRGQRDPLDLLINFTLTDFVLPLLYFNPEVCRNREEVQRSFMHDVTLDRRHNRRVRRSRRWVLSGVVKMLYRSGILLTRDELEEFVDWLLGIGSACPGWRFFSESYKEFCDNLTDQGNRGDIPDFSHTTALPYVDALTLDRRMADYCRRAGRRLLNQYQDCRYDPGKIYANLQSWLND